MWRAVACKIKYRIYIYFSIITSLYDAFHMMTLEWMGLESHQMKDASSRDHSTQKSCLEIRQMGNASSWNRSTQKARLVPKSNFASTRLGSITGGVLKILHLSYI